MQRPESHHIVRLTQDVRDELFTDTLTRLVHAAGGNAAGTGLIISGKEGQIDDALLHYATAKVEQAAGYSRRDSANAAVSHSRAQLRELAGGNYQQMLLEADKVVGSVLARHGVVSSGLAGK